MGDLTFSQAAPAAPADHANSTNASVRTRRLIAATLDAALTYAGAFVLVVIVIRLDIAGARTNRDDAANSALTVVLLLAYFAVAAVREAVAARPQRRRTGQTLGRWLLGILAADPKGGRLPSHRAAAHSVVPSILTGFPLLVVVLHNTFGQGSATGFATMIVPLLVGLTIATSMGAADGATFYDRLCGVRVTRRPRAPVGLVPNAPTPSA